MNNTSNRPELITPVSTPPSQPIADRQEAPTSVNAQTLKSLIVQNRNEAAEVAEQLAPKRAAVDAAIAELEKQYEGENFNLLLQMREANESAASYDQQLREMTVQYFKETGAKRMDADCSVRVGVKFLYDNAQAVEWATSNAPVLIVKTIDKKGFESMPMITDLSFVDKIETPVAVIAKEFIDVN